MFLSCFIEPTGAIKSITSELEHTAPYATFHNTTEEDTDGGRESRLIFKGEQSGGEETTLALIEISHEGTSDDQKGHISINLNDGDDGDSPTEILTAYADGHIVYHQYLTTNNASLCTGHTTFGTVTLNGPFYTYDDYSGNSCHWAVGSKSDGPWVTVRWTGSAWVERGYQSTAGAWTDAASLGSMKQDRNILTENETLEILKQTTIEKFRTRSDVKQFGEKAETQLGIILDEAHPILSSKNLEGEIKGYSPMRTASVAFRGVQLVLEQLDKLRDEIKRLKST